LITQDPQAKHSSSSGAPDLLIGQAFTLSSDFSGVDSLPLNFFST